MKVTSRPAGPAPAEAVEYFRRKKLVPDLDLEKVWGEEHDIAFTVAGVAAEDLLSALKKAVDQALAEGHTYATFAERLEDVLVALGWARKTRDSPPARLKLIYDTNMRTARAAGQWQRITRTAEEEGGRPYLEYKLGPRVHHRPQHVSWAGTILRYDDGWWSSHFPPNGFNCGCWVLTHTRAAAEARGITSSPPAGDPDPGWDRNPGASPRP